ILILAVLAGAITGACSGSSTPSNQPVTPAPAPEPRVKLYVSDETGGAIIVVDPEGKKVIERIAVGKRPRGLKVSRDGTKLYVALSGSPIAGPGVDESK